MKKPNSHTKKCRKKSELNKGASVSADEFIRDKHNYKYNEIKHIELLYELFKEGKGIAEYSVKAGIHRNVFSDWVHRYPEFKEAYLKALCMAESWWHNLPENFCYQRWAINMKNRFGMSEERRLTIPKIKDTTNIRGCMDAIWDAVKEGLLTGKETGYLSNLIMAEIKVQELTELLDRTSRIEEILIRDGKLKPQA